MSSALPLEMIEAAARRLDGYVTRTPALRQTVSNDLTVVAKPECLQTIGAFKLRGAFNMMLQMEDEPGVVAHSSGNHAQAVARAAKVLGIPACIVMPSNAPEVKRERVEADGAEIITVGPDSEERRIRAMELVAERGWLLVPPYDDPKIAAGQGTAALELLDDVTDLDRFYCPMSGGGLMAGCSSVFAHRAPHVEVIGVEPAAGDDSKRSLEADERVAVEPPDTIADGLRVRIPGEWTWTVNRETVDRIVTVTDEEMLHAMAWAADRLRVVLEPSGAASLAAALREGEGVCATLLSGGNVSREIFGRAMCPADW